MSCGPPSATETETETETIPLAQTLTSAHVRMYVCVYMVLWQSRDQLSLQCN